LRSKVVEGARAVELSLSLEITRSADAPSTTPAAWSPSPAFAGADETPAPFPGAAAYASILAKDGYDTRLKGESHGGQSLR
jgi:hypothetical protein